MHKPHNKSAPACDVAAILKKLGVDPIEKLVRIAVDAKNSPALRRRAFLDLRQFVLPKRKAIAILRRLLESPQAEGLFL
jgi:hypothetical protein